MTTSAQESFWFNVNVFGMKLAEIEPTYFMIRFMTPAHHQIALPLSHHRSMSLFILCFYLDNKDPICEVASMLWKIPLKLND